MFDWRDYNNGIFAFDAGYVRPILAAIHMVVESGRVAIVDTGSNDALPNTLEALKKLGLSRDAVDYVILTHIHLDHAGGAGAMMSVFPNAKLVVHPRGVVHMIDPTKLIAGVTAVYGAEYVERVYGEILPIPADRIIEAKDDSQIVLAGRKLKFLDTPGHARHHICIIDEKTSGIFTGDMFGLSYRELDVDGAPFIFPTTTPTQFDPQAMRNSVLRLLDQNPDAMYLTHYSRVDTPQALGMRLLERLDALVEIAKQHSTPAADRHEKIKTAMTGYLLDQLRSHGCQLSDGVLLEIWVTDLELNTQGLTYWLDTAHRAH
jgi:glyoxylase-like metal-dependent hydrolase (beta-lactamase superfamily II)